MTNRNSHEYREATRLRELVRELQAALDVLGELTGPTRTVESDRVYCEAQGKTGAIASIVDPEGLPEIIAAATEQPEAVLTTKDVTP